MGQSISDGVCKALEQCIDEYGIDVKVIFEPPRNSELISEQGREFLNQ